ncbi:pantoate--beta-alanine ligase [Bacillus sp. B15-48]|uniref:pantoate--beta-alanine ligase n=1 Tax=Bacillus sp. B15-48 TaxID=1548601 RepID=UPI00193FA8C7|nr:pantoate--beta-alanine ligase [Bacillus sp. B15-48]MBM4762098.1 pantoate--beta-alanine ligase [Bacillus sp. B15-48]
MITTIKEMQNKISYLKSTGKTIGYVPTMGYLHEGHKALMEKAKEENEILVISIFVNPLQFGPGEDFNAYPRDINHDQMIAEEMGVNYIFYPSVEEMYPVTPSLSVRVEKRTDVLCGKSRPGHFDGVATVLTKLFHIIMPDRVYFGMKDAQQVAVVDGLINDFNFPIKLVPVPTVREVDGLAKSSRNIHLQSGERVEAKELYQSLMLAERLTLEGERSPDEIIQSMKDSLNARCRAEIDYVEIYSYPELERLTTLKGKVLIALAVKFSKVRLIDNLILDLDNWGN